MLYSSTYIWSIYLSAETKFNILCYHAGFHWKRAAALNEATKQIVPELRLKSSLRMFNRRHHDFVNRYGIGATDDNEYDISRFFLRFMFSHRILLIT